MRLFLVFTHALLAGCPSPTDVQKAPIGSACTQSADCGTGKFYCTTAGHPGGYCKADCKADADCPAGSVCIDPGMIAPGKCHKSCTVDANCRAAEGYACKDEGATTKFCDPADQPGDGG